MNFSKQLKKYRELNNLSQEELAGKIYVTRQTISKWENDKSYPDIHNLIALSALFGISLDELVKGDVEIMKEELKRIQMDRDTKGMILFLILSFLIGIPSIVIWGNIGFIPFLILWAAGMYFALRIEKIKKEYNIKTYKEIVAFSEGDTNLEEIISKRDSKKYMKEKIGIVLMFSLIALIFAIIISSLTWLILK